MRRFVFTLMMTAGMAAAVVSNASAQRDTTAAAKRKFPSKFSLSVNFGKEDRDTTKKWPGFKDVNGVLVPEERAKAREDSIRTAKANKGRFIGGITLTRFDLGFSRLIDNGSFNLSPENEFLDYRGGKTSTVSFDVLQMGYRFNSNFKVYVAGGFDWTMIRLQKDITIQPNQSQLTYVTDTVRFSKNRFSNSYVHVPLNFELRTNENENGKRFYFVFGPEIGFLLNGKVKQISDERGKEKFKDNYNFQPFRYGGTVRLGYGSFGIFAKYYMNDMFASAPQKGLRNMSFGVTLGLN